MRIDSKLFSKMMMSLAIGCCLFFLTACQPEVVEVEDDPDLEVADTTAEEETAEAKAAEEAYLAAISEPDVYTGTIEILTSEELVNTYESEHSWSPTLDMGNVAILAFDSLVSVPGIHSEGPMEEDVWYIALDSDRFDPISSEWIDLEGSEVSIYISPESIMYRSDVSAVMGNPTLRDHGSYKIIAIDGELTETAEASEEDSADTTPHYVGEWFEVDLPESWGDNWTTESNTVYDPTMESIGSGTVNFYLNGVEKFSIWIHSKSLSTIDSLDNNNGITIHDKGLTPEERQLIEDTFVFYKYPWE